MYNDTLNWSDITPICELITELDFITDFDLINKIGGFHRTLQRVRLANRERLLLRTPGPVPFGTCICSIVETIFSWTCHVYGPFEFRTSLGTSILLLGQGYVKERLKSSLRKFYGRYENPTKQYEVPLSQMLHDILDDDHIQWHPPLIGHYTNSWPLLIWTLLSNLTFYLIVQGFHRTYAMDAACQQRTLTPPGTWSGPTLGLACVLMSRPISPELVFSPDFWISNIRRYFSFAYRWCYAKVRAATLL